MSLEDNAKGTGKVWLVGAGPSDAELLTVKGRRLLAEADVIVYDRLAGVGVLAWGRPDAVYIDVGKRAGHHPIPQEEINRILVEQAVEGRRVVRLKGGDPLVFGRGGEEASALKRAGVPFEIVPGITSAIAVPAYLGIPVTHRDLASSLHIVTAHKKDGSLPDIRYQALVEGGGTLVFLMGVHTIRSVTAGLLAEGMSPDMPAAVLERGTRAVQRRITGTVAELAQKAEAAHVQSPAIILVGQAAAFQDMDWYGERPLAGVKILVTRPRERTLRLSAMLRAEGAEVLEAPAIRLVPVADKKDLDQALAEMADYAWLVFTSPSGVRIFLEELRKRRMDVRRLAHMRIAVIGEGTAGELTQAGLYPDLMPDVYDGAHLGAALAREVKPGERVLLPRARIGNRELTEKLKDAGADVTDLPIYDTQYEEVPWLDLEREFADGRTYAMFTSASTVRGFVKSAGDLRLSGVRALCIGSMTAAAAAGAGMETYTAAKPTLEALVELAKEAAAKEREDGRR